MQSLLDPAILFFLFGLFAGLVRSNLELPPAISKFLSLYLLMALGLKGGFALAQSGWSADVTTSLGLAMLLAVVVPLVGYQVLRKLVSPFDAAALAATYGSVSAVTFVTTIQHLENQGIAYGGYMAAAMALMESPAIILAVFLANRLRQQAAHIPVGAQSGTLVLGAYPSPGPTSLGKTLHESLTDGAQLLLLGAMLVGLVSGDAGKAAMEPFSGDLFKGMLSLFLLDMGLTTARNLPQLRGQSVWLMAYAVLAPIAHALLALGLTQMAGVSQGDTVLLMLLAASASYIAVPAVVRYAIPEANPTLYYSLSLGITFPLNILVGIPVYTELASHFF